MHKVLNLLFEPTDIVALYSHGPDSKKPQKELIGQANSITMTKNYFCINPLIEPEMGRVTANVAKITNIMFECDNLSLDAQFKAWDAIKGTLPIRTLISSGSSSLHAIFSLVEPLPANGPVYKRLRQGLLNAIIELQPELGNNIDRLIDVVRLSRTDGAYRPDTATYQELLHVGPLISTNYVKSLMPAEVSKIRLAAPPANAKLESPKSLEAYLRINIPYLHTFFCHAGMWAAPAGIYPEIFKNFLWLLEESKCPVDTALELYNTKTVPVLIANGYPDEKVLKPVEHAINYYSSKEAI